MVGVWSLVVVAFAVAVLVLLVVALTVAPPVRLLLEQVASVVVPVVVVVGLNLFDLETLRFFSNGLKFFLNNLHSEFLSENQLNLEIRFT